MPLQWTRRLRVCLHSCLRGGAPLSSRVSCSAFAAMRRTFAAIAVILVVGILSAVILSLRRTSTPTISFTFLGYSNSTARFRIANNSRNDVYVHPFAVIQTNTSAGWTNMAVDWWRGHQEPNRMEIIERSDERVITVTPPAIGGWRAAIRLKAYPQSIFSRLRGEVRREWSTNLWSSEIVR